ncbi:MAG: hypothetical protein LBO08_02505 [Rickettsiales bacterium]|nr:hypothetical protein [Rickettsiales bacterium]
MNSLRKFLYLLIFSFILAPARADIASTNYVIQAITAALANRPTDSAVVHTTGDEIINGQKTFGTDLTVNGDIDASNDIRSATDISAAVDVHAGGELRAGSNIIANGELQITGDSYLSGDVYADKDIYVTGEIHAGDINIRTGQQLTINNGAEFYISDTGSSYVPTPTGSNDIANKSYADTKVGKTGDETIAGTKTFSSIPQIPTAPLPQL